LCYYQQQQNFKGEITMKTRLLTILLAALMLLTVTACNQSMDFVPEPETDPGDYSKIFQMVKAATSGGGSNYGFDDESGGTARVSLSSLNSDAASEYAPMGGGGGGNAHSGTNNQVEGVQESDIVKTDGKNIYVASPATWEQSTVRNEWGEYDWYDVPGRVNVIKTDNGRMEVIAQISLEDANPVEMLLHDNKLIVIWSKSVFFEYDGNDEPRLLARHSVRIGDHGWGGYWRGRLISDVIVQVYDINGDFKTPVSAYSQRGWYSSSRMIGSNIYLITTFDPSPRPMFEEDDLECYIPSFEVNGVRQFVAANDIILPEDLERVQYTVIGGLDVNKSNMQVSIKANLGWSSLIYASLDNIYVISCSYEAFPGFENFFHVSYTTIDKFSVKNGVINYIAAGKVTGTARNQFHFDEYKGVLRVVTEVWGLAEDADLSPYADAVREYNDIMDEYNAAWEEYWNKYEEYYQMFKDGDIDEEEFDSLAIEEFDWSRWNDDKRWNWDNFDGLWELWGLQGGSLFTFDANMNILGQVHGIGLGENVQSVRFMGDIGYIVTFFQVDPLFSFDLSDPRNPKQLDELKIPGFSSYMHPWTDGLLLGIGVDAEEEFGIRTGLKLSMFDVADLTNLAERHVYIIGSENPDFNPEDPWSSVDTWYHGEVEWNHKAALVCRDTNIIAFPYDYYNYNNWRSSDSVYAVFRYCPAGGFTLIGEINYGRSNDSWNSFRRGLYIGDYLYAVADDLIVSARLNSDSITEVQRLAL
jgi:uncharacterized secreted protein with C-terminal beta-propeller domain